MKSNKIEIKFYSILGCINNTKTSIKTMSDATTQFLKEHIVPNYYTKEHFEQMEGWSDEKVEEFKEFIAKEVCMHDYFKEIIKNYIEHFNRPR